MLSVASVVQVSRAAINHQIYLISTQSFISYHPLILCEDPSSTQIHSILAGRKETRILQTIVCSLYSSVEGVGVYKGEEDKTLHVVVYAQAHHISLLDKLDPAGAAAKFNRYCANVRNTYKPCTTRARPSSRPPRASIAAAAHSLTLENNTQVKVTQFFHQPNLFDTILY